MQHSTFEEASIFHFISVEILFDNRSISIRDIKITGLESGRQTISVTNRYVLSFVLLTHKETEEQEVRKLVHRATHSED